MDYISYILAILVIGLIAIFAVRLATRARNPDLLLQYEARKNAVRSRASKKTSADADTELNHSHSAVKSLRQRHASKVHHLTPWGWPGAHRESEQTEHGITESMRNFTDSLMREKRLVDSGGLAASGTNNSIRALLEDRYGPVNRNERVIPYQKVKRPLLRDPSEQHDQLDNLGSVETKQLRQKLQFLSAMKNEEHQEGSTGSSKKVEFRYVELKDLKQPWGW